MLLGEQGGGKLFAAFGQRFAGISAGRSLAEVPFRLPQHSIALRKAMEQLVPESLASRIKERNGLGESQSVPFWVRDGSHPSNGNENIFM